MSDDKTALQPYLDYDLQAGQQQAVSERETADDEAQVFYKPHDGENVVRILPPPMAWAPWFQARETTPTPFFLFWKHFFERPNEAGKWVSTPCPHKEAAQACPLCHQAADLRATGDKLDDELGWDMSAKHKCLVNVIDLDDPSKGPLVWEISAPSGRWKGRTMYEKLRAVMAGRAARNLVTPTAAGYNLLINKTGSGRTGTSYTLSADGDPSPLSTDPAQALEWINGQHDLRKFLIPPTPEQMQAIIEGRAMGPQSSQGTGGSGTKARAAAAPKAAPAAGSAGDYIPAEVVDDDELQF